MRKITLVSLLLAVVGISYAEMYQWRDAEGKVYYTDNPAEVQQKKASVIEQDKLQTINTMPAQNYEDREYRRNQEAYMQQQQKEIAQQREANREQCQKARGYIQQLKNDPPRLMTIKPDGTRHYYTNEEIQAHIRKEEAKYQKYCTNF